jgi:hypothetical protein
MDLGAFGLPLQMGAPLFAFFIIDLDIPLFSVLTQYNCFNAGMCSTCTVNIIVIYLPWCLGWMFYEGEAISKVLSWGSVLFTSAVAFALPLYLAFKVTQKDNLPKGLLDVYGGIFTFNLTQ